MGETKEKHSDEVHNSDVLKETIVDGSNSGEVIEDAEDTHLDTTQSSEQVAEDEELPEPSNEPIIEEIEKGEDEKSIEEESAKEDDDKQLSSLEEAGEKII